GIDGIGNFYFRGRLYPAAIARYKEVLQKYPDYSKMPDTLFHLAESFHHSGNDPEAGIYYARIVSDFPLSERVKEARQQLVVLKMPVPEANPVALARAQSAPRDERGVLGSVIGVVHRKPLVSADTAAASNAAQEESEEAAPAPVRGGTTGSGAESGG